MQILNYMNSHLYDFIELVDFILFTIGLWHVFGKCKVEKKWALVPVLRVFKVSECADVDEIGIPWFIMELLLGIGEFLEALNLSEKFTSVLGIIVLPISICVLFFRIKAYYNLVKVFQVKRKKGWTFLCVVFSGVATMVLGLSKKYQPYKTVEEEDLDDSTSTEGISVKDKGLTVDLKSRIEKKAFGLKKKCILKDIRLNIEPGKMVLLLGGSGAGKSTLLNAITGYEPAKAEIYLNGRNVYTEFHEIQHDIGFVPQQDLIRYNDTIKRTVTDYAKLRLPTNVKREEANEKIEQTLDIFGLQPIEDNVVAKQSGGQKKRTSISMEFVTKPSLFILDEPDSGLDGVLAYDLMQRLHNISRTGKIVIVITHSPDRVLDLFDEVIVIAKDEKRTGRLIFHGPIDQAKQFFGKDKMEDVVKMINRKEEGGEGLADELMERFEEERKAK